MHINKTKTFLTHSNGSVDRYVVFGCVELVSVAAIVTIAVIVTSPMPSTCKRASHNVVNWVALLQTVIQIRPS